MLRGLLVLFLLLTAIYAFVVLLMIGAWASQQFTGLASLALICLGLLLACAAFVVIWAGTFSISPGPTKYLTVLGLIGAVLLSLLSLWIIRERESARRNAAMNNLRQIGMEFQRAQEIRPGVDPSFDRNRLRSEWTREP
jgi:hypothetical protein